MGGLVVIMMDGIVLQEWIYMEMVILMNII